MLKRRFYAGAAGVVVCLSSSVGLAHAQVQKKAHEAPPIVFQPHRAVYDVSLGETAAGSTIAGLNGRMVYELTGNPCDGYTQVLRFVTQTVNQEGQSQSNDLRTTSWENVHQPELRFEVENYHDGALAEESKGLAKRTNTPNQVLVTLEKPENKVVTLDQGTQFPIAHSLSVLLAARQGKTIYPSVFFDGSETGQKTYQTTAVIGKKRAASKKAVEANDRTSPEDKAATSDSWPIAMSYYSNANADGDGTPDFEMSYRFHLNGVTSKFLIDHGDFAFKGELKKLEFLEGAGCANRKGE